MIELRHILLAGLGLAASAVLADSDAELETRQREYHRLSGMKGDAVLSIQQKGFSAGSEKFWIYYFENRVTEQQISEAPSILCREMMNAKVRNSEHQAVSERLQKGQPQLRKLFVKCDA